MRALTDCTCASVRMPRPMPDWFETTPSAMPARRSRDSARRRGGQGLARQRDRRCTAHRRPACRLDRTARRRDAARGSPMPLPWSPLLGPGKPGTRDRARACDAVSVRHLGPSDGRPELLVLRALKLGDLLVAVPAIHGLRRAYPGHRLVLAVPGWLEPIVELIGGVDALLPTPGLDRPVDAAPGRLDIAVNMHGSGAESRGQDRRTAAAPGHGAPGPRDRRRRSGEYEDAALAGRPAASGSDGSGWSAPTASMRDPDDVELSGPVAPSPGAGRRHRARRRLLRLPPVAGRALRPRRARPSRGGPPGRLHRGRRRSERAPSRSPTAPGMTRAPSSPAGSTWAQFAALVGGIPHRRLGRHRSSASRVGLPPAVCHPVRSCAAVRVGSRRGAACRADPRRAAARRGVRGRARPRAARRSRSKKCWRRCAGSSRTRMTTRADPVTRSCGRPRRRPRGLREASGGSGSGCATPASASTPSCDAISCWV